MGKVKLLECHSLIEIDNVPLSNIGKTVLVKMGTMRDHIIASAPLQATHWADSRQKSRLDY